MSEAQPQTDKKKRASKRYPYKKNAQCEYEGKGVDVQILNISTSGIQFASKIKISTEENIRIRWKDAQFGVFEPTFLITREIEQPENKSFHYFYGAQYFNLLPETKQSLLLLLKNFKEESTREIEQQIQKITPMYLMDVMNQGIAFLKTAFAGKTLPYFNGMLAEIKDYEKEAFSQDHQTARCIQRMVTHYFHCSLIKTLTPLVADNVDLISTFLEKTTKVFKEISETETMVEGELKKIVESDLMEEVRKPLQQNLNESSNRLFFEKQAALQCMIEKFEIVVSTSEKLQEPFILIKAEYEKMTASNADYQEEIQVYSRRTKKPEEFSRVDSIVDVPDLSEKKPRYFLYFNIFILFVSGCIFAYSKIDYMISKKNLGEEIGLQTSLLGYNRQGSQIDLVVDDLSWKKLTEEAKLAEFKRIIDYLKKDRRASSAILFDHNKNMIQVLYEDRMPRLVAPPG